MMLEGIAAFLLLGLLIANLLICLCACSRIRARARLRQPILSGDRGSLMRSQVVFIHGFDCDNNRIEDIGECCTYKLVQDPVREGAGAEGTTHVAFKLDDAYRLAKLDWGMRDNGTLRPLWGDIEY